MFVAVSGGREQAKARVSAAVEAEMAALRVAQDDYEMRYGRRPSASELRHHPSVAVNLSAPFNGTARDFAADMKWVAPDRPVRVADEVPDVSSLLPR